MKTMFTAYRYLLVIVQLLLATEVYSSNFEEVVHYHTDALGSPILATDSDGDVLWREEYAPYGSRLNKQSQETECTGSLCSPVESTRDEKQWFTGKLEETRVGIQYFGARWYDPEIGRFLSRDPVGFSASNIFTFNSYTYSNNNPYRYVDPDGRVAVPVLALVAIALTVGDVALNVGHENAPGDDSIQPVAPGFGIGIVGPGLRGASAAARYTDEVVGEVFDVAKKVDPKSLISRQGKNEMSSNQVKKLRRNMRENGYDETRPVDVADVDGRMIIIDGHHRTQGAIGAGIKEIPANITKATREQGDQLLKEAAEARLY